MPRFLLLDKSSSQYLRKNAPWLSNVQIILVISNITILSGVSLKQIGERHILVSICPPALVIFRYYMLILLAYLPVFHVPGQESQINVCRL